MHSHSHRVESERFDIARYTFPAPIDWKTIEPTLVHKLHAAAEIVDYRTKARIYSQGARATHVYHILGGRVKAHQSTAYGTDQILYLYTAGDLFGYRPLLAGQQQPISISCLEPTRVARIAANDFVDILDHSPAFSKWLLKSLCQEFSTLSDRITAFTQYPVPNRIALALLLLERKYADSSEYKGARISFSRTNIAHYVGSSVETVVRTLRQLETRGILAMDRTSIRILNHSVLENMVETL